MLTKTGIRREAAIAIAISAAIAIGGSTSAMAAPQTAVDTPGTTSAVDALNALGLLEMAEGRSAATSSLDMESGLTVEGPAGTRLTLIPISSVAPSSEAGGRVLQYAESDDYQYALTGAGTLSNAGYVVINGPTAPNEFQFKVQVDDHDTQLALTVDGGVDVLDSAGEIVNHFAAPWATDADGKSIATSYRVDGPVITQIVDHAGASYPVVADPQLICDALFCTVLFSKAETRNAASSMNTAAAAVVAACGPAAWACAIGAGVFLDSANQANNQGKCVGIRRAHPSLLSWPVVDACRS